MLTSYTQKDGHRSFLACSHHMLQLKRTNIRALCVDIICAKRHQFSGARRQDGKRMDIRTFQAVYIIRARIETSILRHHKRAKERTSEPSRLSKSYTQEFRHQFSGTTRRQGGKRGRRRGSTLTDVVDGEDATVEVALASSLGVPGDGQDGAARAVGCHQVCWPDRADHTQLEFRWNCGQALASSHTAQNTEISPVQPAICRVQVKRHITLWTGNIINELAQSHKQILNHCSLLYTELKWNATLWMSNINDPPPPPPPEKKHRVLLVCVCMCIRVHACMSVHAYVWTSHHCETGLVRSLGMDWPSWRGDDDDGGGHAGEGGFHGGDGDGVGGVGVHRCLPPQLFKLLVVEDGRLSLSAYLQVTGEAMS